MEEEKIEEKISKNENTDNNTKQDSSKSIAGAILIVGVLITGAILLNGSRGSSDADLPKADRIAREVGVRRSAFNSCLESERYVAKVLNDVSEGVAAGVRGTPTSFLVLDGEVVTIINGAQPQEAVQSHIDEAFEGKVQKLDIDFKPVGENEHILGNQNARIKIVEYSDTECPFCKTFHSTMHRIVDQNSGEVAWVYRHFPIPQLHPNAEREAQATECVAEIAGNEVFWGYLDKIFAQ